MVLLPPAWKPQSKNILNTSIHTSRYKNASNVHVLKLHLLGYLTHNFSNKELQQFQQLEWIFAFKLCHYIYIFFICVSFILRRNSWHFFSALCKPAALGDIQVKLHVNIFINVCTVRSLLPISGFMRTKCPSKRL